MDSIRQRHPRVAGRTRRWPSARLLLIFGALALAMSTISIRAAAVATNRSHRTSEVTSHSYSSSFLACEVTNTGGINDRSFNALAWEGLQVAQNADPLMKIENLQSSSKSDYQRNIAMFVARKCGIIVTVGGPMASATQQAAAQYPKQDFTIVDNEYTPPINNVLASVVRDE